MSSPLSLKSASVAAATVLTTTLLFYNHKTIQTYYKEYRGYKGLLRYIWVGDYLPPKLRQSMDKLDQVEIRITKSDEQLEQIEILIERTRLESVDAGSTTTKNNATSKSDEGASSIHQQSINEEKITQEELTNRLFQQYPKLRTKIGIFSNKLDTLAACIDDIKSHSDDEVKARKKYLSNRIVELMNGLDGMIASLNLEVHDVD